MSAAPGASRLIPTGALFVFLLLAPCLGWAGAQFGTAVAAPAPPTLQGNAARDWHDLQQSALLDRSAELLAGFEPDSGPRFAAPLSGRISSSFGYRNISVAGNRYHGGIDIAADTGTPVVATAAGVVSRAGWVGAYGYAVYIDHPDGTQSRYAHLSAIEVAGGQRVAQGELIALSGSSGASTGPHLHFELRIAGAAVDPLEYLELR